MTDATGPPNTAQSESSGVQETGQQVAGEMQEKAREAAGQAQEKAKETAGQAQDMVREQMDQRSTQAGEKVSGTAGDLRSVGEELRKQGKDGPAKLADKAAERTEQIGSYLRESDSNKLLADVEDLGRRQPLAVLAGGLVVGIAAARFLKASSRSRYQGRLGSEGQTRELGVTPAPPPTTPVEPVVAGRATTQGVPPAAAPVPGR
jgi:hypothetical protein